jgi:hypothetical protein
MMFDFRTDGMVEISQYKYVEDIVKESGVTGQVATPATDNLFKTQDKSKAEVLTTSQKEQFHAGVAKLLYLGKRTRPDILTAVSYLTTRVQDPNHDDWIKMMRVFKYLRGTLNRCLKIRFNDPIEIIIYVDASYGVHGDMKNHSGIAITLGGGAVYAKS